MIPFYRPYYTHTELLSLLRPDINRASFEETIAARAGAQHGLTFGYGRSGLVAIFKALGLTDVEIIIPAYLCQVVARTIVATGNRPRFVDINLEDYNMDLSQLKEAITPQTRAILAVHMYGYPIDIAAIRAAVGNERIMIIEDSALAPLRFASGISDLTLFSFGVAKPLTTVEGGAVATNSADFYEKLKAYREKEMDQRPPRAYKKRLTRLVTNYLLFSRWVYPLWHQIRRRRRPAKPAPTTGTTPALPAIEMLPTDIGLAYSDFQARLGVAQLNKLETILARRRHLAGIYQRELAGIPGLTLAPDFPGSAYTYYTIRVPHRDKSGFRRQMVERGVAVDRTYEYTLPELKPYQSFAQSAYPCATQAAREVINLPCYPQLSDVQARRVAACVREAIDTIRKEW